MDSSGPTLLVGLSDGKKTYSFHHTGIKQEQFLMPVLQRALDKAGAELSDIKRIFFVRGPGRFTGIRISLTFASMLKSLNHAQVRSATLFDILRYQAEHCLSYQSWCADHPHGILAVVLHAFREEYFLQFFDDTITSPMWLSKQELLQQITARKEPIYCIGTDKDGQPLTSLLSDYCRLAPLAECRVRAQTLINMSDNFIYEQNALEPLYLKPARFELEACK